MRAAGFTVIEMLVALTLVGMLYAFTVGNFQSRRDVANFAASRVQGWIWSDIAEVERQRGVLPKGTTGTDALDGAALPLPHTPFGTPYRISTNEYSAVVSADLPFRMHGGGVFTAKQGDDGGTFSFSPSVFPPTAAMRDKVFLYQEAVR